MKKTIGYKFLIDSMESSKGDCGTWELGVWKEHGNKLKMCDSGFHASPTCLDSLEYAYGNRWFIVEAKGRILHNKDKFVASRMRIVREIPNLKRIMVMFSILCAKRCLKRFEDKFPDDKRPRQAIEAAQAWLDNPTDANMSAAGSAALSVESAAGSAALSAGSAAWSAESAAGSAIKNKERRWQVRALDRLVKEGLRKARKTWKKGRELIQ